MTVVEDIARELMLTDTVVVATDDTEGTRRYALEATTRICMIPAVRAARVDSAELVGFIQDATGSGRQSTYDEVAALVVDRFNLDEEGS